MLLDIFYEDQTNNLFTSAPKRIQKHYGLWTEFLVSVYILIYKYICMQKYLTDFTAETKLKANFGNHSNFSKNRKRNTDD